MKKVELEQEDEEEEKMTAIPMPITADQGILKFQLESGDPCKLFPEYSKAYKAIFHYKVYTIPFKDKQDAENWFKDGLALVDLQNTLKNRNTPEVDVHSHPTRVDPNERTKIGDSRSWDNSPFELRLNKGFSVVAFEVAVRTMRIGECARFYCTPTYSEPYIQLEAILRRERSKHLKDHPVSCCAAGLDVEDSQDLYDLMGCPMEMEIQLVDVLGDVPATKDNWESSIPERIINAQSLKSAGDGLYRAGDVGKAGKSYGEAIAILNSCQAAFTKGGESAITLDQEREISQRVMVLKSNYSASMLRLKNYSEVVQHCSDILKKDPQHSKALYRRGKAYQGRGIHLDLARKDFEACLELGTLDQSTRDSIKADMKQLESAEISRKTETGKLYQNIFQ